MTTIDPRQTVIAAVQARLASARPGASARRADSAPAQEAARQAAAAMAQRIAALPATDPDRRRNAVRIFLEAELARALGAAVLNDPGFPALLDAVQDQMQRDARCAAAVDALGTLLLDA